MISFMIGTLGSTMLWSLYGIMSLFMAALIMKKRGSKSWAYVVLSTKHVPLDVGNNGPWTVEAKRATPNHYLGAMFPVTFYLIVWHIVVVFWIIKYSLYAVAYIFLCIMRKLFSVVPEIEIDFDKQRLV